MPPRGQAGTIKLLAGNQVAKRDSCVRVSALRRSASLGARRRTEGNGMRSRRAAALRALRWLVVVLPVADLLLVLSGVVPVRQAVHATVVVEVLALGARQGADR